MMHDARHATIALKARILPDQAAKPIQLLMSAEDAADLSFIANDFACEVVPNSEEAKRLVQFAMKVAAKLDDCLAARSPDL